MSTSEWPISADNQPKKKIEAHLQNSLSYDISAINDKAVSKIVHTELVEGQAGQQSHFRINSLRENSV